MPHPPLHKTNEAKLKNKPSWEIREFEKAVARALNGSNIDEDESDAELETDKSSNDEENDHNTLSNLPGCLLALKGIKDKMLSLTNEHEPQSFVEDIFLQYVKSIKYTDDQGDNGDITIITNTMLKVLFGQRTFIQKSWFKTAHDDSM
ncbi:uncharacterized protein EDB91DRAFT_1088228 [Suillus paluster]|uniref:uncharacterized protein n=1 Tax=Suillus paluster TaxID=48578 RepID=UPI001B8797E0|nr:uncharacterized protein EDB91DRAFT_1088228 [Suillus paluster]KAG1722137.1 hypothetical protein EDB91DRAFT_1088228 [Suillus paluster]